jgi:hypothetical protein
MSSPPPTVLPSTGRIRPAFPYGATRLRRPSGGSPYASGTRPRERHPQLYITLGNSLIADCTINAGRRTEGAPLRRAGREAMAPSGRRVGVMNKTPDTPVRCARVTPWPESVTPRREPFSHGGHVFAHEGLESRAKYGILSMGSLSVAEPWHGVVSPRAPSLIPRHPTKEQSDEHPLDLDPPATAERPSPGADGIRPRARPGPGSAPRRPSLRRTRLPRGHTPGTRCPDTGQSAVAATS